MVPLGTRPLLRVFSHKCSSFYLEILPIIFHISRRPVEPSWLIAGSSSSRCTELQLSCKQISGRVLYVLLDVLYFRGYVQKKKYQSLKAAVLAIQSAYRGRLVRDEIRRQKYEKSVVTIQRYWRGYLVRREEIRRRRKIVKVQACVRRWLAKRRLRELKVFNQFEDIY